MTNLRVSIICIIAVGAFLLPDVPNAKCICTKRINDHCCQTPDNDPSREDACCHIKKFSVEPPQWQCDKNHNSECVEDMDCEMGGKCRECECHPDSGPEPETTPGPEPTPRPEPGPSPEPDPAFTLLCSDDPDDSKPNSTLPNSKSCPFDCPNCCYDNICGADEQKWCYECCPMLRRQRHCSRNKPCVEKDGEVCKCVGCQCICALKKSAKCGDDAVCRTDQDCQNGSNNSTRKNAKCVDCTCMSTMSPDCDAEIDGCSKDSDCPVPEEDKDRCKGVCEKSFCECAVMCIIPD